MTAGCAWLLLLLAAGAATPDRPNVVVIVSDDHGWADLGANGARSGVRTPHLDALARDGVRFARGYVTAPQCVPSRAGLITGRYQQRFGVDDNLRGPLPRDQVTIAQRLAERGYATGMVGKWHLDVAERAPAAPGVRKAAARKAQPARRLPEHRPDRFGFRELFCGERGRYVATHGLDGTPLAGGPTTVVDDGFRVDVQTEAALSFIDRHAAGPFFLYLAYYAPHVPSEAPPKYLDRFRDVPDPTRRVGLAMIAAVDDGVGRIRDRLARHGLADDTLIVFLGDNGAPVKPGAWDGSLNAPLVGEKGMLTDGGLRVPFVAAWPRRLPKGLAYEPAVSSLDILPTALAAATGATIAPAWGLDGVDLRPHLTGATTADPHPYLFWRWRSQAAVLHGTWKLVYVAPDRLHLFDATRPEGELAANDLAARHPEIVADLKARLTDWAAPLKTPGLPAEAVRADVEFFRAHVDAPAP
jgi:uncharacterized sulfatase